MLKTLLLAAMFTLMGGFASAFEPPNGDAETPRHDDYTSPECTSHTCTDVGSVTLTESGTVDEATMSKGAINIKGPCVVEHIERTVNDFDAKAAEAWLTDVGQGTLLTSQNMTYFNAVAGWRDFQRQSDTST